MTVTGDRDRDSDRIVAERLIAVDYGYLRNTTEMVLQHQRIPCHCALDKELDSENT